MANPAPAQHVPVRTCMGCGRKARRAELLRIALTPGSVLVVDTERGLPGRGAWLHPTVDCYRRARKTGRLTRSLRVTNAVDWQQVEDFFTAMNGDDAPMTTEAGWKLMGTR